MKLGKEFLETVANMILPKPQTNADRIRAMSDEELAEWLFLAWHNSWYTLQEWIDWLKSPVEVDNG